MSATDHRQPRARATYFTFPEHLYLFPVKFCCRPKRSPGISWNPNCSLGREKLEAVSARSFGRRPQISRKLDADQRLEAQMGATAVHEPRGAAVSPAPADRRSQRRPALLRWLGISSASRKRHCHRPVFLRYRASGRTLSRFTRPHAAAS